MRQNVILGITGSIAAYKAIDLAKALQQNSHDVTLVLSKTAPDFVSISTLQSLFPGKVYYHNDTLDQNHQMLHITLAKDADLILIAPASANTISKLAHASADCLLSTLCLATKAKIIIAPAMNKIMWKNSLVQKNVVTLREAGVEIIGPAYGNQACGDVGFGRMVEPAEILAYCQYISPPKIFRDKKIVITTGPTREKVDPVRFLSNCSSGKMGNAIASSAHSMGADVVLISGPTELLKLSGIKTIEVESCDEMLEKAISEAVDADIFIGCAAVADYKPKTYNVQKIKKQQNPLILELIKNIDIIQHIKKIYPKIYCVGFAAETENIIEYGSLKLREKNLDMVAINDVSEGQVFGQDDNELHIFTRDHQLHHLARGNKRILSQQLLSLVSQHESHIINQELNG